MVDLSSSLCGYVSLPEDNTGELDTTRSTRSKMNEKNLENRLRGAIMPWNPWTKKNRKTSFQGVASQNLGFLRDGSSQISLVYLKITKDPPAT